MAASMLRGYTSKELAGAAYPFQGVASDYDPLLDLIGNSSYVLLGEASHGTHEFYKARAEITKRLVLEKGSNLIGCHAESRDGLRTNTDRRKRGSPPNPRCCAVAGRCRVR